MAGVAGYVVARAVGDGQRLAPRVVGVPGQHVAITVGDPDNIPLPVEHIVIRAPVVQEGIPRPRLIEHVQQAMAARVLPVQHPVDDVVICHHAAHRFLGAQSAFVVQVRGRHPVFRQARQLPPVPPRHGQAVPVAQRVADPVVGDGLPGVACQQILPRPVRVPVIHRFDGCSQRAGGVGVLLHRQDIPARVVGIDEALVLCRAVRPHQLVQHVVVVGLLQHPVLPDGFDVPVVVVGVGQLLPEIVQALQHRGGAVVLHPHIGVPDRFVRPAHGHHGLGLPSQPVVGVGLVQPAVLADLIHRVGHLAAVLVPVGEAGFHLARAASQQQLQGIGAQSVGVVLIGVGKLRQERAIVLQHPHVAPHPHQPLGQIVGVPRPLGVHHVLVQPHQPIRVVHRVIPRVVGVIVIIVLDDRPVQTVVFVVHPLPVPVQRRRQPVPVVVAVARQRLRGGKDGDRPQLYDTCGRSFGIT